MKAKQESNSKMMMYVRFCQSCQKKYIHTVIIQGFCRSRQMNKNRSDDSESCPKEQYNKKGSTQHFHQQDMYENLV